MRMQAKKKLTFYSYLLVFVIFFHKGIAKQANSIGLCCQVERQLTQRPTWQTKMLHQSSICMQNVLKTHSLWQHKWFYTRSSINQNTRSYDNNSVRWERRKGKKTDESVYGNRSETQCRLINIMMLITTSMKRPRLHKFEIIFVEVRVCWKNGTFAYFQLKKGRVVISWNNGIVDHVFLLVFSISLFHPQTFYVITQLVWAQTYNFSYKA